MKKILSILFFASVLFGTGCQKGFLDINNNPFAVTKLNPTSMLTNVELSAGGLFGGSLNSNAFGSFIQHTTSRELDNYTMGASNFTTYMNNVWSNGYASFLLNSDHLISVAAEQPEFMMHGAIAKALKGYVFMVMTDMWGDIPYSEANKPGIIKPVTDPSDAIYNALLALMKEAKADFIALKGMSATSFTNPGARDIYYKGNIDLWIKAVNTLQLKLLVQSRKASSKVEGWQSTLTALLSENNFIGNGEDLQYPHTATQSPRDERNGRYIGEYEAAQKGTYISPFLYEIMKGYTFNMKANPFAGISDPRVPYYWVNQLTPTGTAQNITDYRDGAFVTRMMATNSGFGDSNQDNSMTCIGIYPVGGKYDDGSAGSIRGTGTGICPEKMMQAYSVPFMKAELILAGAVSGDARAEFKNALSAAIYHVNAVSQAARGTQTVPTLTDANTADFQDEVLARYDAASANGKMEIVMTQKWIANYYNCMEAYSDLRRTGYPVTFKGDNQEALSPNGHATGQDPNPAEIPLASYNTLPRILFYSVRETETNPENVKNGRDVTKSGHVFWDVQ